MGQLPDPPTQPYSIFAKAGKHMKKLRRNWSLTKSDISKSLSRINIMKSPQTVNIDEPTQRPKISTPVPITSNYSRSVQDTDNDSDGNSVRNSLYASLELCLAKDDKEKKSSPNLSVKGDKEDKEKRNSLGRKKNWFKRSASMIETQVSQATTPTSTFYVTDVIEVDGAVNGTNNNENNR